jgi:hypothetical protein
MGNERNWLVVPVDGRQLARVRRCRRYRCGVVTGWELPMVPSVRRGPGAVKAVLSFPGFGCDLGIADTSKVASGAVRGVSAKSSDCVEPTRMCERKQWTLA